VEGDPALGREAKKVFDQIGFQNIQLITSTFEDYLQNEQLKSEPIDLLFLDGNHQSTALLHYYHALKKRFSKNTIIVGG
jgi:predicted O-methyltransferase YrrM